ncbi:MAG: hypothetical protein QM757_46215 [Paludibaculum sp.]
MGQVEIRTRHEVVVGGWTGGEDKMRSLLVGVHRDGKLDLHRPGRHRVWRRGGAAAVFASEGRPGRAFARSKGLARPERPPTSPGPTAAWSPRSNSPAGPPAARCGRPSFKGLREDKPATEVEADAPAPARSTELAEPTPRPATAKASSDKPVIMGVALSNPDKPLWPDGGDGKPITKRELATYYEAVGDWMIGHLKGRPCSIIRMPDGIDGEQVLPAPRR